MPNFTGLTATWSQGVPTQWRHENLVKGDQELTVEHPGQFTVAANWKGCEGGAGPMSQSFLGKLVKKNFFQPSPLS
jgi:hypothetical protein